MKPLTANRGLPFVVRLPNLDFKVSNSPPFCYSRPHKALSSRQYRDFDPAGSYQLPIVGSDGDQCSAPEVMSFLRLYTRAADRKFFIEIDSLPPTNGEHKVFDPIVHSLTLFFYYAGYKAYFRQHV